MLSSSTYRPHQGLQSQLCWTTSNDIQALSLSHYVLLLILLLYLDVNSIKSFFFFQRMLFSTYMLFWNSSQSTFKNWNECRWCALSATPLQRQVHCHWNLDITKGHGNGKICSLSWSGLCSSRARWPLAPSFCPWATRKSQIFHTNHVLGTIDFTDSKDWAPFNFS